MFSSLLDVPACACAGIHAHQRIIVTDNNAGSCPLFSVPHAGFYTGLRTYIDR